MSDQTSIFLKNTCCTTEILIHEEIFISFYFRVFAYFCNYVLRSRYLVIFIRLSFWYLIFFNHIRCFYEVNHFNFFSYHICNSWAYSQALLHSFVRNSIVKTYVRKNLQSGECYRGNVLSGKSLSGKCPVRNCPTGKWQSGICPWGSVSRENV